MGKIGIGINLEFVRHEDKPFEWGVNKAAVLGYDYVEPMDISVSQSAAERGQVTGTPVGCACGEGVIDWARVIGICRKCPRDIVLSVECGTVAQAEASIAHLRPLLAQ